MLISFISLIIVFLCISYIFYIKKPYFVTYIDNGMRIIDYTKLFVISFMISIVISISIFFIDTNNKYKKKKSESILAFDYIPKPIEIKPVYNMKLKSNNLII